MATPPGRTRKQHRLAYGIERIGLIPLRFPFASLIILIALAVAAAFGVMRLKVDDSLSQLFRSNTPEFKQFLDVTQRFPSSEFDVLVVVEGKSLLERNSIEGLRNLVTDLQFVDGTRGIISLFSARTPPENGQIPGPLFPETLPTGAAYEQLVEQVRSNEILRGKLLSEDGQLALIVLALEPDVAGSGQMNGIVKEIRDTISSDLAGTGLTAQLSGVPIMQLEIRNAVERDRLIYNAFGFAAGCLIAIIFFRRFSFMIIAAGPPLIAILLALGALGWLDFRLNMFLNVMTPLIMVISFADSMQLTFAARDRLLAGEDKYTAFRNAVLVVGPACVLTHGTAGISFIALQFSSSDLIRTFGEAGLVATVIALLGVLMLVPLLGVLLIRKESVFAAKVRAARHRRQRAPPLLPLGRRPHGEPPRPLQPDRPPRRRRSRHDLCHPRTALPARRPGAGQGAGGLGVKPARRQAHRRQSDRRPDRVPEGRLALRAGDARHDRRGASGAGGAGRRRQRLVARDAQALAAREGRHHRRRDAQAICRHPAGASDAALHLGERGLRRRLRPHSRRRREPAPARHRPARRDARHGAQGASGLFRSR